jgi:hypothetical protein
MFNSRLYRRLAARLIVLGVTLAIARHAAAQLYLGQGTWVSDDGVVSGTWQGTIDVAGEDLGGDLTITGIPGLTEAKIDGTWYPGVIDFALIQWESEVATIAGTITDDTSVAGTFTMPVAVTGTWQGQIMLVPDDITPTPVEDDSSPAADGTPTPEGDVLAPEDLAILELLGLEEEPSVTPEPMQTVPGPDGTLTPGSPASSPTVLGTETIPAAAPTPTETATPSATATDADSTPGEGIASPTDDVPTSPPDTATPSFIEATPTEAPTPEASPTPTPPSFPADTPTPTHTETATPGSV